MACFPPFGNGSENWTKKRAPLDKISTKNDQFSNFQPIKQHNYKKSKNHHKKSKKKIQKSKKKIIIKILNFQQKIPARQILRNSNKIPTFFPILTRILIEIVKNSSIGRNFSSKMNTAHFTLVPRVFRGRRVEMWYFGLPLLSTVMATRFSVWCPQAEQNFFVILCVILNTPPPKKIGWKKSRWRWEKSYFYFR